MVIIIMVEGKMAAVAMTEIAQESKEVATLKKCSPFLSQYLQFFV